MPVSGNQPVRYGLSENLEPYLIKNYGENAYREYKMRVERGDTDTEIAAVFGVTRQAVGPWRRQFLGEQKAIRGES